MNKDYKVNHFFDDNGESIDILFSNYLLSFLDNDE